MEVEVLDAVGSTNPGSSHTNGYTHSKVNLLTEEVTVKTDSMEWSPFGVSHLVDKFHILENPKFLKVDSIPRHHTQIF